MPMDRKRYPPDWEAISQRIRFDRAGGRCEQCGAWAAQPHPDTGSLVVLSVHHIGIRKPDGTPGDQHDKMDCREDNLICLCQLCHINAHGAPRIFTRRTRHNRGWPPAAVQLELPLA